MAMEQQVQAVVLVVVLEVILAAAAVLPVALVAQV